VSDVDDVSPAARKAAHWHDVIKDWFTRLDTDGSGRIDRDEFKLIAQNLSASFSWDDHQSALLFKEIDQDADDEINLPEFAAWLTNMNATMTFSSDGWLQESDLGDALQPLYDCYDSDNSGISTDQFMRTYRALSDALAQSPVAQQEKADVWMRPAEEEYENLNEGRDSMIDFEDFIQWQTQLLKHSGIPLSLLPERLAGLAKALKVILEKKKTLLSAEDEAALAKSVHKVATLARELYLPCGDQLRKLLENNPERKEPQGCDENYQWENPPEGAVNRLRRDCAINMGVLLPGVMPQKTAEASKGDVWRFARRNSHMRNRMNTPVLGELLLCFSCARRSGSPDEPKRFFAWLEAPRRGALDRNMYYELVPRDDGCGNELEPLWKALPDGTTFYAELHRLPRDQALLALLKTQELAHDELQWPHIKRCLGIAETLDLALHDDVAQVIKVIHTFARKYVVQQPWHREQLDMGMSVADIVNEHLQEATFSPEEVLYLILNQDKMADAEPEPKNKLVATLSKMFTKPLK